MLSIVASLVLAASDGGVALTLEGALIRPGAIKLAELEALGPITTDWSDKKGPHRVKGVRVDKLLLARGFSEGVTGPKADPKQKHAGLRSALVATARDGFKAVFAVGELLETLGATQALIVWEVDGKPLAESTGPFRIVVTTDKQPSRSLHQVERFELVDFNR